MKILVVLAVAATFGVLRFRRVNLLTWAIAWWAGIYLLLRFGFTAPASTATDAQFELGLDCLLDGLRARFPG